MNTEDLIVDDAAEREKVEHICEIVPDSSIAILSRALGVEAV